MKIHSLTILHYGKDYLSYALQSVYHSVDTCHIFYTPSPSHGHTTDTPPIETKEELQAAAYTYDPDQKVKWYDMLGSRQEGSQRDLALQTVQAAGADLVVVVDCDEVWDREVLESFLTRVWEKGVARNNLVNMIHFWRSFNWACFDEGWPVRIIDLRYSGSNEYLPAQLGRVFHFGYAVTDRVMRYKWLIHGHKNELRPKWLNEKWLGWIPDTPAWDCHPTNGEGFWNAERFDKEKLPFFMKAHPFYNLDIIR